ncbi:hypothetical protein BRD18_06650 [Halobacteriales archaeon SW_7_71_33]|nr:MAG: hypothetical protein BRD18_06650 [Halobacteriales archaeon SW_7_71_33]
MDKDAAAELMGSVAFGLIAGFGGLCLAVALSSLFVAVDASNFWPYALAGFAVGAPRSAVADLAALCFGPAFTSHRITSPLSALASPSPADRRSRPPDR